MALVVEDTRAEICSQGSETSSRGNQVDPVVGGNMMVIGSMMLMEMADLVMEVSGISTAVLATDTILIVAMPISMNVREDINNAIKQLPGDTEESIVGATMLQVLMVLVTMEELTKTLFSRQCRQ
jgi:hypothetical protein